MVNIHRPTSVRVVILVLLFIADLSILAFGYFSNSIGLLLLSFLLSVLLAISLNSSSGKKHTLLYNYPIIGYIRYFLETIRPELRQYFWESDLDGRPFNRRQRSIVYQRSKNERQTVPFGTQYNVQSPGHEWVAHSAFPVTIKHKDLHVTIGNRQCLQPYNMSILNIGAMSYGALSKTAISALNEGASLGGFAHNTGEGGISEYHLRNGDLIWQIGTGYFGCRDKTGKFDSNLFKKNAARKEVKMIEIKLSQGAKPGHGGILPAEKNTPEIAGIRNIVAGTTVFSPPTHSAFSNAIELIHFLGSLRNLSGGKPIGIKLCIGDKQQFVDICNAISVTTIIPDFIAIDGSEGGTGAAPLEFTDSLGMPLNEALAFASDTLGYFQLKSDIKIIASGKIINAFDILKAIALGASACYSARGMMFSLGCIQALKCDSGKCPVGIATQNPSLYKGLDISNKSVRVYNFHKNTITALIEMMEACGFKSLSDVNPSKFHRKMENLENKNFYELYFAKPQDVQRLKSNALSSQN